MELSSDHLLSREERLFRDAVREFAERHIAPVWVEIDEKGFIPPQLIARMAGQGLFAIPVPERLGGQGGTVTEAAIAVREIARADPAVATAVYTLLNNGWPMIASLFSNSGSVEELVRGVAAGKRFLGIASTEPQGGSDVASVRTRATAEGEGYRLEGEKTYISGVAEVMETLPEGGGWVTVARTGPEESGAKGISLIVVEARRGGEKSPGIEYSRLDTIGRHGISTGILRFRGHWEPREKLLGEENNGMKIAMQGFNLARILVAAANIGSALWALEQATGWARERLVFGEPLASKQAVAFRLAELTARLEAAWLLVLNAARLADKIYVERDPTHSPRDLNTPAAMAKLEAPRTALEVYEEAMKLRGALSYTREDPLHRGWLGVTSYNVGAEGAENIMRYIIARNTIGRDYVKP